MCDFGVALTGVVDWLAASKASKAATPLRSVGGAPRNRGARTPARKASGPSPPGPGS